MVLSTGITNDGYSLFFANFAAYYIFYGVYHLKTALVAKYNHGAFWSKERSSYLIVEEVEEREDEPVAGIRLVFMVGRKSKLTVNGSNLSMVFIRGIMSALTALVRIAAFYTEALSN